MLPSKPVGSTPSNRHSVNDLSPKATPPSVDQTPTPQSGVATGPKQVLSAAKPWDGNADRNKHPIAMRTSLLRVVLTSAEGKLASPLDEAKRLACLHAALLAMEWGYASEDRAQDRTSMHRALDAIEGPDRKWHDRFTRMVLGNLDEGIKPDESDDSMLIMEGLYQLDSLVAALIGPPQYIDTKASLLLGVLHEASTPAPHPLAQAKLAACEHATRLARSWQVVYSDQSNRAVDLAFAALEPIRIQDPQWHSRMRGIMESIANECFTTPQNQVPSLLVHPLAMLDIDIAQLTGPLRAAAREAQFTAAGNESS